MNYPQQPGSWPGQPQGPMPGSTPIPQGNAYQPPGGPVQDADEFLMGGGVKSASFAGNPPVSWTGTVVEKGVQQKRDFDTGEPMFWQDGRPRMMMRVVIQTDVRDPQVEDDDGKRALYLENRKLFAVRDAVRKAGASTLEVGGRLTLTYVSDDHAAKKGRGLPPKNFTAEYVAPDPLAQVAESEDPWAMGAPAQPAQTPPGAGWGQQQQLAGPPAQGGAPQAATDPVSAFLAEKGVPAPPDPQAALMIARTYGYTG